MINKKELKLTHFIPGLVILIAFLLPYTEAMETQYQWLFMLAHYMLFIGGFLLLYNMIKGSPLLIVPSAFLVTFWHLPLFFNLAAAFTTFRVLNDVSFIVAGALAGIAAGKMKLTLKFSLLVLWMTVDTAFSIVFLLQNPAYTDIAYPFSPYTPAEEIGTAVLMWIVMSGIIAYVIGKFLRELLF